MDLLVDASNIIWRAHWQAEHGPAASTNPNTEYLDIYIFLNMIKSYKAMYEKSTMWLVWDKKIDRGITNPRREHSDDYKNNRDSDRAEAVYRNCEAITEIADSLGINNFYPSHLEADDCIAWLSRQVKECVIFSADSDLLQLITPTVSVYSLSKKALITLENHKKYMPTAPDKYALYKSIVGDTADNIIGLPGYGKVRGAKLAEKWGSVKVTDDIKTLVESNLQIINLINNTFVDDLELQRYNEQFDRYKNGSQADISRFETLLKQYHQKTHLKKMSQWQDLFVMSNLSKMLSSLEILK